MNMELRPQHGEPGTYVAKNFSELERQTLREAFTEYVGFSAIEIFDQEREEEEVMGLEVIPDVVLELALLEEGDSVVLTTDDVDNVRKTLMKFAEGTEETVRAKLKETDRHDLSVAESIPQRIQLGRSSLKLQQEFASQNTIPRAVDGDAETATEPDFDKFLASIGELASPGENPNS